ncbi:hypothetical protein QZN01_02170 [Burkholderia cenocepacia]|uniref:hypothetical protein n=1 Tax=Burkholderia cenocepacia TaxID=95486 RepID=UPI000D0C3FBF|nr:hypothetical protein [Burkholderia cenocepacia]MDN7821438.1 hypothetical protein [Burkholderia cenocepacia]SOT43417.1 conserved hypothetical protein [Burkholderia cenocepacia]HEM9000961.1 hypothetical protein [Burkholderia cenocepacia]
MNFTTCSRSRFRFSFASARGVRGAAFGMAAVLSVFTVGVPSHVHAADQADQAIEVDRAGNRLESLNPMTAAQSSNDEEGCTADRQLCVEIVRGDADHEPALRITRFAGQPADVHVDLDDPSDGHGRFALWPRVLRGAGGDVIVGVRFDMSTGYSGGGASASELRLTRVVAGDRVPRTQQVLAVPLSGSATIRACFSERDQRRRLGACHDDYAFDATLSLDRSVRAGLPRLLYATRATSFPGHVSRDKDSLAAPPLRKRDLVTAVDRTCTYRRTFRFDPSAGSYTPDRPLPDCEGYTVP